MSMNSTSDSSSSMESCRIFDKAPLLIFGRLLLYVVNHSLFLTGKVVGQESIAPRMIARKIEYMCFLSGGLFQLYIELSVTFAVLVHFKAYLIRKCISSHWHHYQFSRNGSKPHQWPPQIWQNCFYSPAFEIGGSFLHYENLKSRILKKFKNLKIGAYPCTIIIARKPRVFDTSASLLPRLDFLTWCQPHRIPENSQLCW